MKVFGSENPKFFAAFSARIFRGKFVEKSLGNRLDVQNVVNMEDNCFGSESLTLDLSKLVAWTCICHADLLLLKILFQPFVSNLCSIHVVENSNNLIRSKIWHQLNTISIRFFGLKF